jgi:hypothetical protein
MSYRKHFGIAHPAYDIVSDKGFNSVKRSFSLPNLRDFLRCVPILNAYRKTKPSIFQHLLSRRINLA